MKKKLAELNEVACIASPWVWLGSFVVLRFSGIVNTDYDRNMLWGGWALLMALSLIVSVVQIYKRD